MIFVGVQCSGQISCAKLQGHTRTQKTEAPQRAPLEQTLNPKSTHHTLADKHPTIYTSTKQGRGRVEHHDRYQNTNLTSIKRNGKKQLILLSVLGNP